MIPTPVRPLSLEKKLERGSEKKEKSLRRRMIGERNMRRRRERLQRYQLVFACCRCTLYNVTSSHIRHPRDMTDHYI
jgi:hypothetical protein